jgi:hypothetical protein
MSASGRMGRAPIFPFVWICLKKKQDAGQIRSIEWKIWKSAFVESTFFDKREGAID